MKRFIGLMTLATILCLGNVTFAAEKANPPQWKGGLPHVIEGQVVKIDGGTYTVRDSTGRELRVHVDENTQADNSLKVGDRVFARIAHIPADVYAKSLQKSTLKGNIQALPNPIEGEVLKTEGDVYIIRDVSGKEVRLQVDKATKMDSNLTVGDRIVARIDNLTAPGYATSLTKR
jgi:uncharacterized protein YdeI (BOF family)